MFSLIKNLIVSLSQTKGSVALALAWMVGIVLLGLYGEGDLAMAAIIIMAGCGILVVLMVLMSED